jgi:glycosyltransferase involved in cell wall biosynthesis
VVIGSGGAYKKKVQEYVREHQLESLVLFLSDSVAAQQQPGFRNAADFPAIYSLSSALVYPSIFEGFGIPILEAMARGVPVLTSNLSCMPETGGDAALYVDPLDAGAVAASLARILEDQPLAQAMSAKGIEQARHFSAEKTSAAVMDVYQSLF